MIAELIDHLKTALVTGDPAYKSVKHSWDIEPFDETDVGQWPAALVFVGNETSDPSNADNRVKQRAQREVMVYTLCRHDELDELRDGRLMPSMLGWQPSEPAWDAIQHERGQVRKLNGEYVWWLDSFTTYRIRSQA